MSISNLERKNSTVFSEATIPNYKAFNSSVLAMGDSLSDHIGGFLSDRFQDLLGGVLATIGAIGTYLAFEHGWPEIQKLFGAIGAKAAASFISAKDFLIAYTANPAKYNPKMSKKVRNQLNQLIKSPDVLKMLSQANVKPSTELKKIPNRGITLGSVNKPKTKIITAQQSAGVGVMKYEADDRNHGDDWKKASPISEAQLKAGVTCVTTVTSKSDFNVIMKSADRSGVLKRGDIVPEMTGTQGVTVGVEIINGVPMQLPTETAANVDGRSSTVSDSTGASTVFVPHYTFEDPIFTGLCSLGKVNIRSEVIDNRGSLPTKKYYDGWKKW
jgi:hypothetical protein